MNTDYSSGFARRIRERASEIFPETVSLRREIHLHPELSYEEVKTTALIDGYLRSLGIEPEPPFLETGVVALLRGEGKRGSGNLVALRADIDALPVTEENSHAFCSLEPGKMHACGHDMHTAMLL
ncbi:MAG: M20/M25/M40 family metallo-hydrolase, partial [Chlorobium sp.]